MGSIENTAEFDYSLLATIYKNKPQKVGNEQHNHSYQQHIKLKYISVVKIMIR